MKLFYIILGIALVVCRFVARRWWQLRLKQQNSRRGARGSKAPLPELPQRRSIARSEAAKDAEAEYTAKQLQQHLPVGPQYLSREELIQQVKPADAEMALCSLYSNRYYTQKRLTRASKKLGIPELIVYDQFEDRRVGLRFCTFVTPVQDLGGGCKVAAAVFAVRGTRLTKTGTVQADIQLLRDRDAELYYSQRALKHVQKHIRKLSAERPDVQWGFFITGHSLGGFAAATCLILCDRILTCTAFESPGLTTFYHRLAAQQGGEEFWRERITNYLAIPNPINMCQKHLGRIIRVHFPRLECRTDATHVLRCTLGTGVRILNWMLAASAGFSALCLAAGISRSGLMCRLFEAWVSECVLEAAVPQVAASAYWTLQSAAAMVATQLGTTLRYIMQQHSMWHMAQAFDPVSGKPKRCVEMASWPRMERMMGTFGATISRALLESFYATPSTEGLSVIFNRTAMVEARVRRLPGYTPMPEYEDGASEGGAFLWRLGDAFELWDEQGDALEEDELQRELQPEPQPARCSKEHAQAELLSPLRSRRAVHKAVDDNSPPRLSQNSAAQTGYDTDDEGEGEHGRAEEAEEPDDAPAALPPPRAMSPRDDGLAALDAPGPRLLDGYDSEPCGADAERRARRRPLRRSIGRRAGGRSALRAASSIMDSLCKALGDMPDDVDCLPAFGDHWGSDGFEMSGLDPTESELDKTGSCTAAQGTSCRSFRPSRPSSSYMPSPFDCDSTSGTDAYEAPAYQPYKPALRTISSLPTSPAAAQLPGPPSAQLLQQDIQESSGGEARRPVPSAEALSQAAPMQQQQHTGEPLQWRLGSPQGSVDAKAATPRQPSKQPCSSEHTLPPSTCRKPSRKEAAAYASRERAANLDTGVSSGGEDSIADGGSGGPAAGRAPPAAAQDLRGWLGRPWMWAGLKRGIKRRAAQVQS